MASSLLATDGYKFSMAEAGWPLRQETFYYAHRKGGVQVLPVDVEALVRRLLPEPTEADYAWLARYGYEMGAGFKAAVLRRERLTVHTLPRGALFYPREPVFSVSGPSALVSWLEPLLLQIHFRIQVATQALADKEGLARALALLSCEAERQIVLETLDEVDVQPPRMQVDEEGYYARVLLAARELVEAVEDPGRLFEVGLRAATCMEQHELALRACKEAGIVRTSNAYLAQKLGLVPVGTMGHEHVQRYGSDEAAFRAMRERRPQRSSYLLDTYDTLASGLPAAFQLMREEPGSGDSIRFDSGNKRLQYLYATTRAREEGVHPVLILEDGLDAQATREFEELRRLVQWEPQAQFYGYGGFLVSRPAACPFTRDRVAAVYKLSRSGTQGTMKFANEQGAGKQSVPGFPVVFRRRQGTGPVGLIGQQGEPPPEGYFLLTGSGEAVALPESLPPGDGHEPHVGHSPATQALVQELRQRYFPQAHKAS